MQVCKTSGWLRSVAIAVLSLLITPLPARAHLVATGIGPYFDGIAHTFVSLEDALAMAGAAVLAGLNGKAAARAAVIIYPLAWFAGTLFGMQIGVQSMQPSLSIVSFLGLGAAIAGRLRLNPAVIATLTFLVAFAFGFAASVDLSAVSSLSLFMMGSLTAMTMAMILISAIASSFGVGLSLIAMRALGSWLAAAGILMLGWTLRGV